MEQYRSVSIFVVIKKDGEITFTQKPLNSHEEPWTKTNVYDLFTKQKIELSTIDDIFNITDVIRIEYITSENVLNKLLSNPKFVEVCLKKHKKHQAKFHRMLERENKTLQKQQQKGDKEMEKYKSMFKLDCFLVLAKINKNIKILSCNLLYNDDYVDLPQNSPLRGDSYATGRDLDGNLYTLTYEQISLNTCAFYLDGKGSYLTPVYMYCKSNPKFADKFPKHKIVHTQTLKKLEEYINSKEDINSLT